MRVLSRWIKELFSVSKPIIGVVHLPPLPGSPLYRGEDLENMVDYAVLEARKLAEGGVDGVIVENYGDKPYAVRVRRPETIAAMTVIVREVVRSVNVPVGVSVLRNSGPEAMAIAGVTGASFIRVNAYCEPLASPEGILTPVARETLEVKARLNVSVRVLADVRCKHASPLHSMSLEEVVHDCFTRCLADAIVITGVRTGQPPLPEDVAMVRKAALGPVIVGSGITSDNISAFWNVADGFIVGTSLKVYNVTENPVDPEKVKAFMSRVRELRAAERP